MSFSLCPTIPTRSRKFAAGLPGHPVSPMGALHYTDTANTGGFGTHSPDIGNISAAPIDHGPRTNGWKPPPLRTGNDWRSGAPSPFKANTGAFEPTAPKPLPSAGAPMMPKMASTNDPGWLERFSDLLRARQAHPAPSSGSAWEDWKTHIGEGARALAHPLTAAKRYVSNLPSLYAYDARHIDKAVNHLPQFYELGIKDQQAPDSDAAYRNTTTDNFRRELLRRGLGVHTSGPDDALKPNPDGTLQVADRFFKNDVLDPEVAHSLFGNQMADTEAAPQTAGTQVFNAAAVSRNGPYDRLREGRSNPALPAYVQTNPYGRGGHAGTNPAVVNTPAVSGVFAHYPLQYKGNGIFNASDKWDVGLNPGDNQTDEGSGAVGMARKALNTVMTPAEFKQDFQQRRDGSIVRINQTPVQTAPKPIVPKITIPAQPAIPTVPKKAASIRDRIAAANAQVATPSEKQIETGNYQKGHFTWNGLGITIETAAGQTRSGVNKSTGKPWSVTLKHSYGYIKGTDSAEPGDQMDIFMGPHPESDVVFIVDQNKQDGKTFDEAKVMAGFLNAAAAKQAYLDNYSAGWKGFRSITALTVPQFKSWLQKGDVSTPLAGQAFADFHKKAGLPPAGKVAFESMNPFITVKRASGLRGALQTILGAAKQMPRPSGAQLNKALNPWVSSGSVGGDLAKGIGYSGAAAVPTTEFINDHVYGDMMRRHYTGADGLEHKGLDSQSKALELASNTAMLMPLFHRGALKHMVKNPTPALLGKGATTMVIPSIADIFASTQNANEATKATADAMQNVGKVAESAAQFAGPLKDFVEPLQRFSKDAPAMLDRFRDTMRENRSYATPIMSGALGAGLGNMAGHYLEDDGKRLSAAEQTRQKRNRILLTLLGGGIGTVAGMRGTQGLPPLSPSGAERTAMTAKFHELLGRLGVKKSSVVPEFKPDGATRRADDAIALQYKYSRPAPEKLPAVAPSVPTVNGVKMWMPSAAPRKPVGAAK